MPEDNKQNMFEDAKDSAYKISVGNGFANNKLRVDLFRKGFLLDDSLDQPTYLTFVLDFDFDGMLTDNLTGLVASPLLCTNPRVEMEQSALKFFMNRGMNRHVGYVEDFQRIFKYISTNTPWYFQSVSGLDKLWETAVSAQKTGMLDDISIEIGCLEGMDLRLLHIAELYHKIVYNQQYMRSNLPANLRQFQFRLYIGEARDIYSDIEATMPAKGPGAIVAAHQEARGSVSSSNNNTSSDPVFRINSFYWYAFDCYQCEFDFSNTFEQRFDAFIGDKPNESRFKIKIGRVETLGSFGTKSFTSNHYKDLYSTDAARAQSRAALVDGITEATRSGLQRENMTLMKIANSLGPFSQVAKSGLLSAERKLNNITRAPNSFINSAISEIQKRAEGGSLGNALNQAKKRFF